MAFDLYVTVPGKGDTWARFDNVDKQSAILEAQQKGWTVHGGRDVTQAPATSTPAAPAPRPPNEMALRYLPGVAQAAAPAALEYGLGVTNPIGLAAAGLGAGLGAYSLLRGGGPTLGDVGQTVFNEAFVPMLKGVYRAGRVVAPRPIMALERGVPAMARRLGLPQTATKIFGQTGPFARYIERGVPESAGREEAEAITTNVPRILGEETAGAGGRGLPANPLQAGNRVRQGFNGLFRQVPRAARPAALTDIQRLYNIDPSGFSAVEWRDFIRRSPAAAMDVIERIGRVAGAGRSAGAQVQQRVLQSFWSTTLSDAVEMPATRLAVRAGQGFRGHLGGYIDGNAIIDAVRGLSPLDRQVLGPAVDDLVRALGLASGAQRALPELLMQPAKGAAETVAQSSVNIGRFHIPLNPFIAATALVFGHEQLGEAAAFAANLGLAHPVATGSATALAMAALGTKRGVNRIMTRLMMSEAGMRWIATGIEAMARGAPERTIIPMLARSLPGVLRQLGPITEEEHPSLAPKPPEPPLTGPPSTFQQQTPGSTTTTTEPPPPGPPGSPAGAQVAPPSSAGGAQVSSPEGAFAKTIQRPQGSPSGAFP